MPHVMDFYWEEIDRQLEALQSAKTADEVIAILPPQGEVSVGDGWFGGGGGDVLPDQMLVRAGWRTVWFEAPYYWCMVAPNGDTITYVEGDIYRGDQRPNKEPV